MTLLSGYPAKCMTGGKLSLEKIGRKLFHGFLAARLWIGIKASPPTEPVSPKVVIEAVIGTSVNYC